MKEIFFSAPFFFSKIIPRPSAKISIITYQLFFVQHELFLLSFAKKNSESLIFHGSIVVLFYRRVRFFLFSGKIFFVFL
jgi:hypothetical protein